MTLLDRAIREVYWFLAIVIGTTLLLGFWEPLPRDWILILPMAYIGASVGRLVLWVVRRRRG